MSAELTFEEAKRADRKFAAQTLPLAEIPGHWLQDPAIEEVVFERTHPEMVPTTKDVHFGHPSETELPEVAVTTVQEPSSAPATSSKPRAQRKPRGPRKPRASRAKKA